MKILIADDNEDYRKSIKRFLEDDKYKIEEAGNSDEAIKMAQKERYDLIVTDNDMRDGYKSSGLRVIEEVRKSEKNKKTPILFSSSYIPEEIEEKAKKFDVEICDKMDFLKKVKKFLEK